MLKYGFNQATCLKNSTTENDLLFCEKHGYDYIELRLDMLKEYLKTHTMEDLQDFFANNHLKPFALNSIEHINFCSEEKWAEVIELFTFACEVAQKINNPYIVVVPTCMEDICTKDEKEVFEDSVDVLNKLADIAEPYGVKLAFEPIGDRHVCCRSVRQALEIVNHINRDSIGLTIDCINVYLHDKCTDVDYIKKVPKEKLFVFHINDCDDIPLGILNESHRIMPGMGVIPVKAVADAVMAVGYEGPACLELFRPEYWNMDAEAVIELGAKCIKPFIG